MCISADSSWPASAKEVTNVNSPLHSFELQEFFGNKNNLSINRATHLLKNQPKRKEAK